MKRIGMVLAVLLLLCTAAMAAPAEELPVKEGEVRGQLPVDGVYLMAVPRDEEDLQITPEGLQFIKDHEGYVSSPYDDYSQQTIGYGCNVTYATKYGFDPTYLTRQEAHDLLVCVVWEFEQRLDAYLDKYQIRLEEPYMYDALVSFAFNCPDWLSGGNRITRMLTGGTYTPNEFASAMGIWCHAGGEILQGLVRRRIDEITLFLYGTYEEDTPRFCTLEYRGKGSIDNDIEFFLKGEPYGSFTAVEPPEEGYVLEGWFTAEGRQVLEEDPVEKSLVVYTRWREIHGYEVLSLQAEDSKGNLLDTIPNDGFYLSAEIYKALDGGESVLLLTTYSQRGQLLDIWFLRTNVPAGTRYTLGVWVDDPMGQIAECRAFVLDSLGSAVPLCEPAVLKK